MPVVGFLGTQSPDAMADRVRIAPGPERNGHFEEHVWGVGDILMWDNRCTLHARTDFSADERRLMRRVTILGEKPL